MAENQVEEIKQKVDITAIIGERLELKRAGKNLKGLCPFHGEKTPSFFVSPDMQLFTCFGCGVKGDVYTFLQQYESWTFVETLEYLANKAGVRLENRTRDSSADAYRERLYELLSLAQEYYHYLLTEHTVGRNGLAYLKGRGVSRQSIRDFHLGYAPHNWRSLLDYLVGKKGFKPEEVEAAGLAIRSSRTSSASSMSRTHSRQGFGGQVRNYYDRFRGRIMFPLTTTSGRVVGFSGRIVQMPTVAKPDREEVKYINTPETKIYHKGELLFGLSLAKQGIRESDRVLVMEGEMDVILSRQAFVDEVVAIKGSALTEAQALLLKRLTGTVVLCLDADAAGQEAMRRAIVIGEKVGLNLRVLDLKGGKDPADLAQANPKKWREMSQKTESVHEFLMNLAFEKHDPETGEGQKAITHELLQVWGRLTNAVEQAFWLKKLAQRLGVGLGVLERELQKATSGIPDRQERESLRHQVEKKQSRRETIERFLLAAALQAEGHGERLWTTLKEEWFENGYLSRLLAGLKGVNSAHAKKPLKGLLLHMPVEQQELIKELYLSEGSVFEQTSEEMVRSFERSKEILKELYARNRLNGLAARLSQADLPEVKKRELRAEYQQLAKEIGAEAK